MSFSTMSLRDVFHVEDKIKQNIFHIFGKTEESANQDVGQVKEWLKTQTHLPEIMEDAKIMNFLRLNQFDVDQAKHRIDMYYTVRTLIPDFFQDANPKTEKLQRFMDTSYCCVHPKLIENKFRCFFFKTKQPNQFSPTDMVIQNINIAEIRFYEDVMFSKIFIFDMENITAGDLKLITPTVLKKIFAVYERIFALRLHRLYFINSPSYVVTVIAMLKQILPPEIFDKVQVHQDAEILNSVFTKEELPKDYGGKGPSLEELNEIIKAKLAEYQDRFNILDDLQIKDAGANKIGAEDILGFHPTFKNLDLD